MKGEGFLASVGALSAARMAAMASQVLVLPIIARHVSPAEFGVVALAMSVAAFANIFSDAGMGRSLIRTPLSARDEWSSVFWFLAVLGTALALGFLALTPAASWFFEDPRLFWPLVALAPMPLILSLNAAFAAEMEQRRVFAELALSQVAATAVALGVAVWMAVAGFGVWALIAQQLLLVGLRALWVAARSRFRPGLRFSRAALGAHFGFGRDITAASLLGYLGEQSTVLAIGKALGAADLGLYAMATRFARLPMFGLAGPFGQVLYVRLTQAAADLGAFRTIVLSAIRCLAFVILPPMAALAAVSDTAFTLLLSDRWAEVAPIFMVLAGGAALQAATQPTAVALAALGQTTARLRLTAEITVFWLLLLGVGAAFGLLAIAAARTAWMLLQLPRHWAFLGRGCGVTGADFLAALAPGALTAAAILLALGLADMAAPTSGWAWLGMAAAISAALFAVAALACKARLLEDVGRLTG